MGLLGSVILYAANARATASGYTMTAGSGAASGTRDVITGAGKVSVSGTAGAQAMPAGVAGTGAVSISGSGAASAASAWASSDAPGAMITGSGAATTSGTTAYGANQLTAQASVISPTATSAASGKSYNQRKRRTRAVVFSFRMQK